jgi:rubrerythrin
MKRTFTSLSSQEALHVAIFIEERNADIYRNFADLFAQFGDLDSMEISLAFSEISSEERRHSSRLQQRYFERFGTSACSITDDDISDLIEVPRLQSVDVFDARDLGAPPRHRAFAVVAAAQASAIQFYRQLVETTSDPELRSLFQEFVDMELQHAGSLEQHMGNGQHHAG